MKFHTVAFAVSFASTVFAFASATGEPAVSRVAPLPRHLSETGLYVPGSTAQTSADVAPFSPQYPLWSDGATKRRWLHIPRGTFIDGTKPDAWVFPIGTKLWKEFAHDRRVETRFIERVTDGTWRFATYIWNEAGTDATLAPDQGVTLAVGAAPDGRYSVPARGDCLACHEGAAVPVLGASALQLSPDRDASAAHGAPPAPGDVDLTGLIDRGWLRNLPPDFVARAPRIAASTSVERAALGYLHGNCGHCHNDSGAQPPVDLQLDEGSGGRARADTVLASVIAAKSRYRAAGLPASAPLIAPGHAESSVLTARMRTRNPQMQMPPLGTRQIDTEGLALVERWINHLASKEKQP